MIRCDLELRHKYAHLFEKAIHSDLLELIRSNCHSALRYKSDTEEFFRQDKLAALCQEFKELRKDTFQAKDEHETVDLASLGFVDTESLKEVDGQNFDPMEEGLRQ